MRMGSVIVVAAACTTALILSACSSGDGTGATPDTTVVSTVAVPPSTAAPDDGVLRIGVLAPLTGDGATLGLSLQATVELAVAQINETGGVNGRPVQLQVADEGADIATATSGVDELARADVDAIIGPTSSTVTLSLLDTIRRDHILSCSPTATAMSLDDFPDDGLFFRTAPSDSLQAEAIARAIDQTGRSSVGLLYVDDAYGRPFADRVRQALANRSITVTANVPFLATDSSVDTQAKVANVLGAPVIAVIGAADSGSRVVAAILEATPELDTPIIVNDAMRGRPAADTFAQFPDAALERITGIAPRALTDNEDFLSALATVDPDASGLFAVNAFDCVNLIALAADAAESTDAQQIASRIPNVATSGTRCLTYADCAAGLVADRNIDYDGPSGLLQLAFDGDPNRGVYDVFHYTADGGELPDGRINV